MIILLGKRADFFAFRWLVTCSLSVAVYLVLCLVPLVVYSAVYLSVRITNFLTLEFSYRSDDEIFLIDKSTKFNRILFFYTKLIFTE